MHATRPQRLARLIAVAASAIVGGASASEGSIAISPASWRVIERDSGPVNYYRIVREQGAEFVRARYRPPLETVILGWQAPDSARKTARRVRWDWRAITLPTGGNDCIDGKGDSAAAVYVTWKRGLKYYTLKYVWSGAGVKGNCRRKRNPFVAEDVIVVRAGPPLDVWQHVDLDLRAEFRKHFEGGNARASVPDFVGLGIITDGDQTNSPSAADYGSFVVSR